MRYIALCLALATPASAWEFSSSPICSLSQNGKLVVEVTYDASLPEYAIHLTRHEGWPPSPIFAIRFEGPFPLTIATDRHQIKGNTLSVRDRGFGNVLRGMARNVQAVAILRNLEVPFSLDGAAPAVAEFRDCPSDLSV
ncbi:MAG: excinuclease ABC subunit B [Marinovum sp.]|nr:excinuclease ABC subunit B [Marinovum sp.]